MDDSYHVVPYIPRTCLFYKQKFVAFDPLYPPPFLSFCLFRATPTAWGGSQARGLIRGTAASLHQSHSSVGSELRLRPIPQLTATPDP